jgi:CheY-like chemotaxis protein
MRAIESLDRNANLQAKFVEDLLDASRIERGAFQVDMSDIPLPPIVDAAVKSVAPLADAKGVHVEADLATSGGHVMGDAARLQQVVWNLLTNAIKFTPAGGRIQVRLAFVGGRVRLDVSDTGEGIAPALLPQIFEPFRQVGSHTTATRQGVGLGLAIVKTIVERHSGTVGAASEGIGRGTTITVELPALSAGQHVAPTGPIPPTGLLSARDLTGVRALVVDDDSETRELLTMMLKQYGARVTTAGSAREALEILQRDRPDVLLSDIRMPDEDGYGLIASIRALDAERGGQTPAVAVTAYGSAEDRERLLAAGFQRHIVKPVNADQLAAVVAEIVPPSPSVMNL